MNCDIVALPFQLDGELRHSRSAISPRLQIGVSEIKIKLNENNRNYIYL